MKSQGLYLTDIAEWRAWLERNHDAEKEVWLVFSGMKGNHGNPESQI